MATTRRHVHSQRYSYTHICVLTHKRMPQLCTCDLSDFGQCHNSWGKLLKAGRRNFTFSAALIINSLTIMHINIYLATLTKLKVNHKMPHIQTPSWESGEIGLKNLCLQVTRDLPQQRILTKLLIKAILRKHNIKI